MKGLKMIHEIIDAHVHLPVADELKDFVGKKNKLNASLRDNNIRAAIIISDSEIESTIGSTSDCVIVPPIKHRIIKLRTLRTLNQNSF